MSIRKTSRFSLRWICVFTLVAAVGTSACRNETIQDNTEKSTDGISDSEGNTDFSTDSECKKGLVGCPCNNGRCLTGLRCVEGICSAEGDGDTDADTDTDVDTDTDADSDTDTDTDADIDADTDADSDSQSDPFDEVDCTTTDCMSCDYYICSTAKTGFDTYKDLDCTGMEALCSSMMDCYEAYASCLKGVCPPGESLLDADTNGISSCATVLTQCVGAAADSDADTDTDADTDIDTDADSDSDADADLDSDTDTDTDTDTDSDADTDTDADSDTDTDTDADTDSDADTDADVDTEIVSDPFDGLDCNSTDCMSCDYYICSAAKNAYDTYLTMDCTGSEALCDAMIDCYAEYVGCMKSVCPAGSSFLDADNSALTACLTGLTACSNAAPTS